MLKALSILDIYFSESFNDDHDIVRQMRLVHTRFNILLRNVSLCSNSANHQLFESYCLVFYCPFLWTNFKAQSYHKSRVSFSKVQHKLLN